MSKKGFRLSEIIIISMCAALGIAVKSIIVPLAQMVTGPLFIPGGVVAGGFYMLFLIMAGAITGKRGASLLAALIQAVLVTITGTIGSHGAASLFTYLFPGLAAELVFLISRHRGCCAICCFFACMAANVAGSFAVNFALFKLSALPLLLSLCAAALFGGLGGLLANLLAKRLRDLGILRNQPEDFEP
jgi:ABC-type thiamin/hydroxymethylpyrimidine transport system permease subunit